MGFSIGGTEAMWNPKQYDKDFAVSLGVDCFFAPFLTDVNTIMKKLEKYKYNYFKSNFRTAF